MEGTDRRHEKLGSGRTGEAVVVFFRGAWFFSMTVLGMAIGYPLVVKALATFLVAALPVRVTTNSGDTVAGNLVGLTESTILIDSEGEPVQLRFDEVSLLRPVVSEEKTGPAIRVTLLDGSRVAALSVSLADDTLEIKPRRQKPLRVKAKDVKSIRFRPSTPATDPRWLGLLEQPGRGDVLVIRRGGDRMDPYQGVIQSISGEQVSFELDGDSIDAPLEKLEGVIFGGNRGRPGSSDIQVIDVYGSTWSVVGFAPSSGDQPLKLKLDDSIIHEIPLSHVESIRWSSGLQLLASAKPAQQSYKPYFASNVDTTLMEKWFAPTRDGDADLLLYGGSWIEYRVEPGFRTFAGSMGRDGSVGRAGDATVMVLVDGQVKWKEKVIGSRRLGFELPVENARRIRIEVDRGGDGDLGDSVRIIRPRLTK